MEAELVPVREGLFAAPDNAPPYLIGGRCTVCGAVRFPWRTRCVACFSSGTVERLPLSRRGKLYTFTVVRVPPVGYETPYAFGYVDLPEGLRVFALLGGDLEALQIGQTVELELAPYKRDRLGRRVLGYRFVPVPTGARRA